jgi:hypothetical protein
MQKAAKLRGFLLFWQVERAMGFEPTTPTLASGKLRCRHIRLL